MRARSAIEAATVGTVGTMWELLWEPCLSHIYKEFSYSSHSSHNLTSFLWKFTTTYTNDGDVVVVLSIRGLTPWELWELWEPLLKNRLGIGIIYRSAVPTAVPTSLCAVGTVGDSGGPG